VINPPLLLYNYSSICDLSVMIRLLASNSGQRLSRQHSSVSGGVSEGSRSPGVDEAVHPQSAKMWRLLKVNRPEWGYGALGCVGSALSGLMFPALALIISNVLYAYYKTDFSEMQMDISKYALILLGLAGVSLIGHFSQNFFFGIMSENLIQRVREMMFARKL
jgi:ATP-binding cassette subfamily B (MDR/TAP) protein 1